MTFNSWNLRKILVAVGALPFVIGAMSLASMLGDLKHTKMEALIAVLVIFIFGFFMVSLRRSVEVDGHYLKEYWHLFFVFKKVKIEELKSFSKIVLDTATATQGMGSVSSSRGRIVHLNYYRLCLKHGADSEKDYFISEHVYWERKKGLGDCIDIAKKLAKITSLRLEFSEQVKEDAKEINELLI